MDNLADVITWLEEQADNQQEEPKEGTTASFEHLLPQVPVDTVVTPDVRMDVQRVSEEQKREPAESTMDIDWGKVEECFDALQPQPPKQQQQQRRKDHHIGQVVSPAEALRRRCDLLRAEMDRIQRQATELAERQPREAESLLGRRRLQGEYGCGQGGRGRRAPPEVVDLESGVVLLQSEQQTIEGAQRRGAVVRVPREEDGGVAPVEVHIGAAPGVRLPGVTARWRRGHLYLLFCVLAIAGHSTSACSTVATRSHTAINATTESNYTSVAVGGTSAVASRSLTLAASFPDARHRLPLVNRSRQGGVGVAFNPAAERAEEEEEVHQLDGVHARLRPWVVVVLAILGALLVIIYWQVSWMRARRQQRGPDTVVNYSNIREGDDE